MQLTPLRFEQAWSGDNFGIRCEPCYGRHVYHTDCGRFRIVKTRGSWYVSDHLHWSWFSWLRNIGLANAAFTTRRELLQALEAALAADGLMDADTPL